MSGSTPPGFYTRIRVEFQPYNHTQVQNLLRAVQVDFGRPGDRWHFLSPDLGDPDPAEDGNGWKVDFWFKDSADAVLFALKYNLSKYQK